MRLLDTDVMVDVLRGFEPALRWIESLDEAPGLPGLVVMELMGGCAVGLGASLCTFNVKHFSPFLTLTIEQPCERGSPPVRPGRRKSRR